MQFSSRLLYRAVFITAGLMLFLGLLLAYGLNDREASAITQSQWDATRGYIQEYIDAQYVADSSNGESGFIIDQASLKARLDSNNDGVYLGNGDNAANAPVLVDNLMQQTTLIPGTSYRCRWTGGTDGGNCLNDDSVSAVRDLVTNHEAAGFSTDIVVYCVTGHTEAPTTGAFGIVARTGAFGSAVDPRVYAMKWGRNGWSNTLVSYSNTNSIAAADAQYSGTYAQPAKPIQSTACESEPNEAEMVACQANWALMSTGGNVGNGQSTMSTISAAGQTVDVRVGSLGTGTLNTAAPNIQVGINTLFTPAGLGKVHPTSSTYVASRTPMMGGIGAVGLKMLGYSMGAGGFINNGNPGWNNTMDEKQVSTGVSYPLLTVSALTAPAKMDTTAPTQSGISAGSITGSSAVISRTASEPATMKVQYGTTPGGPYPNSVNNTTLNTSKSVTLTGLNQYTTYYYKVTSYDAQANPSSASAEMYLTTPDLTAPTISNIQPSGTITTSSATFSADLSDTGSGINPSTAMIHLDGPSLPGCTATASSITCSKSGLTVGTHTILVMVTDNAGNYAELSQQFTVADATAPTVSNIMPTGAIASGSTTVSASFADAAPSSGINPATASLTVTGATVSGCSATASGISCTASGMGVGSHTIDVSVSDNAGNPGSGSGSFTVVDNANPSVTYIGPSGTIADSGPTVTGSATDGSPSSGLASASLSLNGGAASACSIDGSGNVSCSTSGLSDGDYSAVISVTDNAGNTGTASGSFTVSTVPACTPAKPALKLETRFAYWASPLDYSSTPRRLTVRLRLTNNGTASPADDAFNVAITGASNTNNAVLINTPYSFGDIAAGASADRYVVYEVDHGVTGFISNMTGSADDSCGVNWSMP